MNNDKRHHKYQKKSPLYDKYWSNNFCKIAITVTACILAIGVFISSLFMDNCPLYIDFLRSLIILIGGFCSRFFK